MDVADLYVEQPHEMEDATKAACRLLKPLEVKAVLRKNPHLSRLSSQLWSRLGGEPRTCRMSSRSVAFTFEENLSDLHYHSYSASFASQSFLPAP